MLDTHPAHGRYTLRPVTAEDFDFLWRLKVATLKPYIEQTFGWEEDVAKQFLRRVMQGADLVLVDGQPAGILKVVIEGDWMHLAEIGLLPERQNQGLGTRIIRDVIDKAESLGLPIELQVFADNPAAKLYERLGFSITHHKMWRKPGKRR